MDDYVSVSNLTWTPTVFSVYWCINPTVLSNFNQGIGATNNWGSYNSHVTNTGFLYVGTDVATRFTIASAVVANQYQSFCFTYNSGNAEVYKNGVSIASKSGMTAPVAWTGFVIGSSNSNTVYGNVPLVQIYNRALSAQEVLQNYNATKARFGL